MWWRECVGVGKFSLLSWAEPHQLTKLCTLDVMDLAWNLSMSNSGFAFHWEHGVYVVRKCNPDIFSRGKDQQFVHPSQHGNGKLVSVSLTPHPQSCLSPVERTWADLCSPSSFLKAIWTSFLAFSSTSCPFQYCLLPHGQPFSQTWPPLSATSSCIFGPNVSGDCWAQTRRNPEIENDHNFQLCQHHLSPPLPPFKPPFQPDEKLKWFGQKVVARYPAPRCHLHDRMLWTRRWREVRKLGLLSSLSTSAANSHPAIPSHAYKVQGFTLETGKRSLILKHWDRAVITSSIFATRTPVWLCSLVSFKSIATFTNTNTNGPFHRTDYTDSNINDIV